MQFPEYLKSITSSPPAWLKPSKGTGVVVSSRIRLARNLAGRKFPSILAESELKKIWNELEAVLGGLEEFQNSVALEMDKISPMSRQILFERHLISREQLQKGGGSGIVMRRDEFLAVMVNEEDHMRVQSFQPGLNLVKAWQRIDELETAISEKVDLAFTPGLGYLSCCPTNVGTGMRASVLVHLPSLSLLDEIRPVVNGLSKIGLMVRGLWGEGSDIAGHMFQVSNQITLGKEEFEIVQHLDHIVRELAEHEENARARLLQGKETLLRDHVGRARGILDNAYILSSREALDLLSALRLGVDAGLVEDCDTARIDELLLLTQPAHLQMAEEERLNAEERDEVRAKWVRQYLKNFENRKEREDDE